MKYKKYIYLCIREKVETYIYTYFIHGKNDFTNVKIILLEHQNNYVERLSIDER